MGCVAAIAPVGWYVVKSNCLVEPARLNLPVWLEPEYYRLLFERTAVLVQWSAESSSKHFFLLSLPARTRQKNSTKQESCVIFQQTLVAYLKISEMYLASVFQVGISRCVYDWV